MKFLLGRWKDLEAQKRQLRDLEARYGENAKIIMKYRPTPFKKSEPTDHAFHQFFNKNYQVPVYHFKEFFSEYRVKNTYSISESDRQRLASARSKKKA